jgi:hypothetical protein
MVAGAEVTVIELSVVWLPPSWTSPPAGTVIGVGALMRPIQEYW